MSPLSEPDPAAETATPFRTFWMGGYEGADHVNGDGVALDMVRDTRHLDLLDDDYARAARLGIRTVRESIGWRLAEPSPGCHDLARAAAMAQAARRHGMQVHRSLMHYGTPPDVSLFDDAMIGRFAAFAAAVARRLAPLHDVPPVYTPINEIGFLSWVVSSTSQMAPYRNDDADETTRRSGYAVKRRLVRAAIAAMDAIRAVDPRARFLHVEPVVHVVAPADRPELAALAHEVASYQWQAWDLLAGRLDPEIGGRPECLDLVGVNHYHSGQWEVVTERRLQWHARDPRRRPLSALLDDVWRRYRRPLIVAETSHFGAGRADWLNEVADEVRRARRTGVPVSGVCLYPLVDRFDWNRTDHWHRSGLWEAVSPSPPHDRPLCLPYAHALRRWQRELPHPRPQGSIVSTLIVFSHLRWGFVYQRPQHLLSRLAEHHRVLFVEEPVRTDGPARLESIAHSPTLHVLVPHTPVQAQGFHDDQLPVLRPLLDAFLAEQGIDDYDAWFYTPMALPLISRMRPRRIVYDCMDELSAFKGAPLQLRQRETALLKLADLVLTGGPSLYEAKRALNPNVHLLASAVDAAHFRPRADDAIDPAADALQGQLPRPRLGFFGVVDERMDLRLLDALASARPDWQIVMVGPVVKIDPRTLPKRANIHWLGLQPYELLPHLMAGWDVCLMPFALNRATRYISPTKTLEYLAGDRPVVSTAVTDVVLLYGDVVRIARSPAEFVDACAACLAETPAQREQRLARTLATVLRSSWDAHAAFIHDALLDGRRAPAIATPPAPEKLVRAG